MICTGPRSEILFDFGWKFHRGDMEGAELPEFDDASWRSVDLPHDYSIEDIAGTDSPFDPSHPDGIDAGLSNQRNRLVPEIFHGP